MHSTTTSTSVVIFTRIFLHQCLKILSITSTDALWIDYQYLRNVGNHRYRNKALLNVVIQILIHGRCNRVMGCANKPGISIWSSLCSSRSTNSTACTTAVINNKLLTKLLSQLSGQWPCKSVRSATSRERVYESN